MRIIYKEEIGENYYKEYLFSLTEKGKMIVKNWINKKEI